MVTNGWTGLLFTVILLHILVPATVILVVLARNRKINQRNLFFPVTEKINNYVAVVTFLLPLVYSILTFLHTNTGCCGDWQLHFGLAAFIFCWAHLICLFSKFPFIGEQSIVFLTIVRTFLKLSIFGLLLVFAAVIVLMVVFFDAQATVTIIRVVGLLNQSSCGCARCTCSNRHNNYCIQTGPLPGFQWQT